jgi:ribosomal protein S27AE
MFLSLFFRRQDMSTGTKACPKCGGTARKTHDGRHETGHTVHTTLHMYKHGHPLLALAGAVATGLKLLGFSDRYQCDRCQHAF